MGGINHQPCNKYLGESTRLSRFISLGRAHFELANVALEDILIAELFKDGKGAIGPMRHHLQLSQDHILQAIGAVDALIAKMKEHDYQDLPPLHELDLVALGRKLTQAHLIDEQAWTCMSTMMKDGTFRANAAFFKEKLGELLALGTGLHSAVVLLHDHADDGRLHEILEENHPGNLKAQFAELYTAWNRFNQNFLASSLVSTEVWYAHTGVGSILEPLGVPTTTS